jgi:hypothetical protein
MSENQCRCWRAPFWYGDFNSRYLGLDDNGPFAAVSVEECKHCDQKWLQYLIEEEGFSKSGRWYRVPLSDEEAASVRPATAVQLLSHRSWHFRGGSYFNSAGARCDWQLDPADL